VPSSEASACPSPWRRPRTPANRGPASTGSGPGTLSTLTPWAPTARARPSIGPGRGHPVHLSRPARPPFHRQPDAATMIVRAGHGLSVTLARQEPILPAVVIVTAGVVLVKDDLAMLVDPVGVWSVGGVPVHKSESRRCRWKTAPWDRRPPCRRSHRHPRSVPRPKTSPRHPRARPRRGRRARLYACRNRRRPPLPTLTRVLNSRQRWASQSLGGIGCPETRTTAAPVDRDEFATSVSVGLTREGEAGLDRGHDLLLAPSRIHAPLQLIRPMGKV
jgi:hypothetical protein